MNKHGELNDSIFALTILLITFVHNISVFTAHELDLWVSQLRADIDELAVTKHGKHIEIISDLVQELQSYVSGYRQDLDSIVDTCLVESAGASESSDILQKENETMEFLSDGEQVDSLAGVGEIDMDEFQSEVHIESFRLFAAKSCRYNKQLTVHSLKKAAESVGLLLRSFGSKSAMMESVVYPDRKELSTGGAVLEASSQLQSRNPLGNKINFIKLTADYRLKVIRWFSGDGTRHLPRLLFGNPKLRIKGVKTWSDRLNSINSKCEELRERYQLCIDEKRNFWAFILGLFSIYSFPLAVLTGYFGMNFNNMDGNYSVCV